MLDDIDNLLDDAIALHEEKKFFLASVKYLNILEQDASHADTNHNFGLLKVELGLKEEALIFLQTAINTNPNVLQYWVTFINTLTNVGRFDDASSVLEQAHLFGHKDKTLNHLRHNLDLAQRKYETLIKPNQLDASRTMDAEANYEISVNAEQKTSISSQADSYVQYSDKSQTNVLDTMKLDKALKPDDSIYAIAKEVFEAYAIDEEFRDIIESKRYAELGVHPSGEAFKTLPIELKQGIPNYIKENVDLERLANVG